MIPKEARDELRRLEKEALASPWRTGRKVFRTLYSDDHLMGVVDKSNDAALIAAMRNALIPLLDYVDALEAIEQAARRCRERYKMEFHSDGDSHALCEALAALDKVRP